MQDFKFTPDFNPEFARIRRSTKAITDEKWIKDFLHRSPVGVLATVYHDQPFLSTKLFYYDENSRSIFMHSADEGRVRENVRRNPKVCFTVYKMGRILPSEKASGFGLEYQSVVVFGKISIVDEIDQVINVLNCLMGKYAPQFQPGEDYQPVVPSEISGLVIYRLEIASWSAKHSVGAGENPGAYRYDDILKEDNG